MSRNNFILILSLVDSVGRSRFCFSCVVSTGVQNCSCDMWETFIKSSLWET